MTTKLTLTAKRANTLLAIRENFDLYPADWHQAVSEESRLAHFIEECVDAYVESEPERYARLTLGQHLAIAQEAVERFAAVEVYDADATSASMLLSVAAGGAV